MRCVRFTTFELRYPELVRFRYKVEGVDQEWIDPGTNRFVDWSPPGPGRYRFIVEARGPEGVWSSAPATAVLNVHPAWWQTTVARAAALFGVIIAGVLLARQRIRTIERRHAAELRIINEQRRAEHELTQVRGILGLISAITARAFSAAGLVVPTSIPKLQ